jgi:hypothetical protein
MAEKELERKTKIPAMEESVLTNFARISPKVAKGILKKVDMIQLLAPTPTLTSTDRYQRIQAAIQKLENAANDIVGKFLRNNLIADIIFVIVTVAILVAATYLTGTANSDAIIATLGVSGVTWASQARALYEHVNLYNREKKNVKISVESLKADLELCERTDNKCLERVETLIRKTWELLRGSSQ